ncbi:MAG: hypothetical protein RLZZ67_165 [Candidatus Parcubacteria bacterium]|jgi:hypothetical protein
MISVKISGGLGNQLFQYSFGKAQSLRNKTDFILDISNYKKISDRSYQLDAFAIGAPTKSLNFFEKISLKTFNKKKVVFESTPQFRTDVLLIKEAVFVGNWQSEKYFIEIESELRKELTLKKWSQKGEEFKKDIEASSDAVPVSIHIRRGDIAANPHLKEKHGVLDTNYYKQAVAKIRETVPNPLFYIFSDDTAWVKENLAFISPQHIISDNGLTNAEELSLMSLCSHNIIANSTFSWWGAWLNKNQQKIVIAPKRWFASDINSTDLLPEKWLKI